MYYQERWYLLSLVIWFSYSEIKSKMTLLKKYKEIVFIGKDNIFLAVDTIFHKNKGGRPLEKNTLKDDIS